LDIVFKYNTFAAQTVALTHNYYTIKVMKQTILSILALVLCASAQAGVEVQQVGGWYESGYVKWSAVSGATDYNVYVKASTATDWTQLDKELVRQYPSYYRADAVGLAAGEYQFKVVPVGASGEMSSDVTETSAFTATAHDRSGFAHVGMSGGIGAYKNDGTLKDGAKVIYVWADNAKTVSTVVKTGSSATTTATGLQNIIYLYQKGYDTTPLDIRVIGTIKADDMDSFGSSSEGLQIKGKNSYSEMPITIEGIGEDAGFHGFGVLIRNCKSTEIRNMAIMWFMDDALSLDTDNSNIWIHNNDFFYGQPGSDSDQAKGDGTVDMKAETMNVTLSYNHFFDSGKSSLGGMKGETTSCWHTYHHNWFDHSDSRHPRVRTQFYHVYNNYYDGISKYGVGVTTGGAAFVENNYFRNCKYPMLISKQGTDAEGSGTFSGEDGGVIKAYNNEIINPRKVQYYDGSQTNGKWDAVLVTARDEAVTATAYSGGTSYNSEADAAARTTYIENKMDAPADVPAIVRGSMGAGRMNHGDFQWTFKNSAQDENYGVISALKTAIQNYQSTLVGFADGTAISNGGATETVNGGDGVGMDQAENDAYVPTWAGGSGEGGGGSTPSADSEAYIATDNGDGTYDYFWFNADNEAAVNAYIESGVITLDESSKFQTTSNVAGSDGTVYSDKVGSLQLAKGTGTCTFYCPDGITSVKYYLARTGGFKGSILGSDDGVNFTEIETYEAKKGVLEVDVTVSNNYKYVQLTNTATGSLHVQGVIVMKVQGESGIKEVKADRVKNGKVYDLQGRKADARQKGMRIVGGKVVMER
jgi:pectate lyase